MVRSDPDETAVDPSDEALLELALSRFRVVADAEAEQRKGEVEDLKFIDENDQWPADIRKTRQGSLEKGFMSPPRPCLTINKLKAPLRHVQNQQRSARLALQINPKSGGATQDTAEVLQGLIRHIEVESRAHMARSWAFDRAVKAGRGAYRVLTAFANDGDFDLDIVIKRILNQASVYLDPFAQEPDWSDGEWAFITEDIPAARYKRQFPQSRLAKEGGTDALDSIGDTGLGWIKGDGPESWVYRVAEYWYVEFTARERVLTESGTDLWDEDYTTAPAQIRAQLGPIVDTRTVQARQVKWCKINAVEVLDREDWDGRYIPIIPVIGDEYYVDGKRLWKGMISDAQDAQRSYNYMRSALVESIGLAPKAPWIMAEGQDEGYEDMWAQSNIRNFAALKYRPVSVAGQPVAPPQRNTVEPAIQAITIAIQEADNDIKATTGVGDPSLGQYSPQDRSGKALQALQRQSEHVNSNFMDNLASVSMTLEGKILLDLIPHVYFRPGRVARILGEDDTAREVVLNQSFVTGPNGQPRPVAAGTAGAQTYDLSAGQYSVTVSVGKSYQTRRQEGADLIGEVFKAHPAAVPIFLDLYLRDLDFPAARAMADRAYKMLPAPLQGENGDGAAVTAQLGQAQQQLQAMQQQMQQMQQALETKQIETEARKQIEFAKIQSKQEIEALQIGSKERIAQIEAQVELAKTNASLGESRRKTDVTLAMTAAQQQADLQAKARAAETQRAHEAALGIMQAGEAETPILTP